MSNTVKCNFCNCDVERSEWDSHVEDPIHLTNVRVYNQVVVVEPKQSKVSGGKIGTYCLSLLRDKSLATKTYEELAAMARAEFGSKTSKACMAWYVSHHKMDKTIVKRIKPGDKPVIVSAFNELGELIEDAEEVKEEVAA